MRIWPSFKSTRERENIWIKGGGGGGISQWKSYIFIRICPLAHKSIPKCCKPIEFTIVFLTAVEFLFDLSMPNASNGFSNIVNNCISAAIWLLFSIDDSSLFCGIRIKSKVANQNEIPSKYKWQCSNILDLRFDLFTKTETLFPC